jgi:hypothetical protein
MQFRHFVQPSTPFEDRLDLLNFLGVIVDLRFEVPCVRIFRLIGFPDSPVQEFAPRCDELGGVAEEAFRKLEVPRLQYRAKGDIGTAFGEFLVRRGQRLEQAVCLLLASSQRSHSHDKGVGNDQAGE